MDYVELICKIQPYSDEIAEILMAELGEIGYESFVQTDDSVEAYIQAQFFDMEKTGQLRVNQLPNYNFTYSHKIIEPQDWNAVWEAGFKPVVISDQVMIRASFHDKMPEIPYDIVIDPKMSFGTGHHSTTSLMVQSILETGVEGKRVLDMGCGTSLLAILASKRGAAHVDAIDIDEWPYKNSLENIKNNKVENVSVHLGDASLLKGKSYDVVLANINRNILLNDMKHYAVCLPQNGVLVMSGFYTQDLPGIKEEAGKNNLTYIGHKTDNDWVAARFVKE